MGNGTAGFVDYGPVNLVRILFLTFGQLLIVYRAPPTLDHFTSNPRLLRIQSRSQSQIQLHINWHRDIHL